MACPDCPWQHTEQIPFHAWAFGDLPETKEGGHGSALPTISSKGLSSLVYTLLMEQDPINAKSLRVACKSRETVETLRGKKPISDTHGVSLGRYATGLAIHQSPWTIGYHHPPRNYPRVVIALLTGYVPRLQFGDNPCLAFGPQGLVRAESHVIYNE
jgi:hypothetical protein